jgi:GT2 family glycosyltransferase
MPATFPIVTVIVPHYKTLDMTKLCLRLLRKHTDTSKIHVIVVDNGSNDASTEYLKTVEWIELIIRGEDANLDSNFDSHSKAMDIALEKTTTPYVLSIHTDTFVTSPHWLDYLLEQFQDNENIAAVGSWKLESNSFMKRLTKKLECYWQSYIWFPLTGKKDGHIAGKGKNYYYLRSHCAIYRTELIRQHTGGFFDGDTAGKVLHRKLEEAGYKLVFLASDVLNRYISHLNHATAILNPEKQGRKTGKPSELKRIKKQLLQIKADQILNSTELDKA